MVLGSLPVTQYGEEKGDAEKDTLRLFYRLWPTAQTLSAQSESDPIR
jgi:hypothetical protein